MAYQHQRKYILKAEDTSDKSNLVNILKSKIKLDQNICYTQGLAMWMSLGIKLKTNAKNHILKTLMVFP